MASEEPQLPPNSPIQVENIDNRAKIWYPANPGKRTPIGMIVLSILLTLVFLGMAFQVLKVVILQGKLEFLLIFLGVALSSLIIYLVVVKPTIQLCLESQTLEVDQNQLKITKKAPFYHEEKTYPFDDILGIAHKHPKRGNVSKKFPTIITDSGNNVFFEAATQPEGEWVVQYLKYWLK